MIGGKSKRGFGSMVTKNPERQKEIAAAGGRKAQASGKAHRFTSEEARAAGKIGGRARHASA